MPLVSVVMAARNEAANIGRAVRSILAQTLVDWELIVVDDGSTDGTGDIVDSLGEGRIRVLRRSRSGLPSSLNAGLAAARAPLVARQDADDYSLPTRLERQTAFLDAYPEVVVVGSAWREVDARGVRITPRARIVHGPLNRVVDRFNPITHTTATFRRAAVVALGGYDERLPYAADYDLWLRIADADGLLWNLDDELAVRVMGGSNMSATHERAQIREELVIRWRDVQRRRRSRRPIWPQARRLPVRAAMLLAPVPLRRAVRRRQGKAP